MYMVTKKITTKEKIIYSYVCAFETEMKAEMFRAKAEIVEEEKTKNILNKLLEEYMTFSKVEYIVEKVSEIEFSNILLKNIKKIKALKGDE